MFLSFLLRNYSLHETKRRFLAILETKFLDLLDFVQSTLFHLANMIFDFQNMLLYLQKNQNNPEEILKQIKGDISLLGR